MTIHKPATRNPAAPGLIDRRTLMAGASLATLSAGAALSLPTKAQAQDVSVDELMKKTTELEELTLGPADAKVVVVEYASMTCGHCARFHKNVFPELKKKYIETNKIRFIMREFPLDNLAAAASMLARCAGEGKTFPMIDVLFDKQADWAFVRENPVPALFEMSKQAGFTKESFETCLGDENLLKQIVSIKDRGASVFGITSTPTFFVNGTRLKGGGALADFEKIIDPLLAAG